MTVHCEGECGVLEQLGERYEFETELTRQGFRHEDFALHVMRERPRPPKSEWVQRYAVTVVRLRADRRKVDRLKVYSGGSRQRWVAEFARDLADGAFGAPEQGGGGSTADPHSRLGASANGDQSRAPFQG
jgi:hypothetical protein